MVSVSGQAVARGLHRDGADAKLPDAAAALRQARTELQAATEQAALDRDPLAPVLVGLSSSLGALQARLEAARPPLDAKERAELTRQLVQAWRADFVRPREYNPGAWRCCRVWGPQCCYSPRSAAAISGDARQSRQTSAPPRGSSAPRRRRG